MNPSSLNLQELANAYEQLQNQLASSQNQINDLQNRLLATQNTVQNQPANVTVRAPKIRKPEAFKGKGSVQSWINHMSNYLSGETDNNAMIIAVSYLEGSAHEWWIGHSQTPEGQLVQTWSSLKDALSVRFETLNKSKIARDKLAKWRQVKDVSTFNDDFQRIILDIPNISIEEQIDRYTRGLKPYIWRELCTREYTSLNTAMRDAERVESAHRRVGDPSRARKPGSTLRSSDGPTPMEIGNLQIKKLTPAERRICMREGRCFRCREKGHTANKCPKGRGN